MVILTTSLAFPSFAADPDTLDVSLTNAAGLQNEEITIELNINENPGFSYFVCLLYYDSDTFILRDTELNDEFSKYLELWDSKDNVSDDELTGPIASRLLSQLKDYNISSSDKNFKLIILEPYGFDDIYNKGTIIKFTFQIMGIAEDGEYTIGILPSNEDIINAKDEDLDVIWTNASVRVGSEKVPEETQKVISYEDTVDASDITEDHGKDDPSTVTENDTSTDTDKEPGTSNDDTANGGSESTESNTEKETDVEVETNPSSNEEVEMFGNKVPVLYIIIGALVLLIAAAAILTAVFLKSKKKKQ